MKPSLITQDETYERAMTNEADYALLLSELVKHRRQLTISIVVTGLLSVCALWRDSSHIRYVGDLPSAYVVALAFVIFFATMRFTIDVNIKLLKAIKAARKSDG